MNFGKLVATTAALAFSATTLFAGADIFVIGGKLTILFGHVLKWVQRTQVKLQNLRAVL